MAYNFKFLFIIGLSLISIKLLSQPVQPSFKIKTSGAITDFVLHNALITAATDAGTIETYNLKDKKQVEIINLPEMTDFMGDPAPRKVYSIDYHEKNKFLLVTQGKQGFRNIMVGYSENFKTLLDANSDKMMVKKARFVNDETILFATISNELIKYSILKKEIIYKLYISAYTFSDFSLSSDKQFVFTSDESGIIHKIDVKKGEIVKEYLGNNVDNVYVLKSNNDVIITAGQDRRVGIYKTISDQQYYLQKDFLVYCVGLNEDGTIGAYSASEESDIELFETNTQLSLNTLEGHESTVTKIEFINNNQLVTSSNDNYLMFWDF